MMGKVLFFLTVLGMGGLMSYSLPKSSALMRSSWVGKFSVLVIAHRGFSGVAPENTLSAFKKAIDLGVDMIELDVHLSKDGQVVVIHDDTLDRTTNGKGRVAGYTLIDLKKLDAGSWFGSSFSGEKIPTLKEVLELSQGRVIVNIEIKRGRLGPYTMINLADQALHEVIEMAMEDQVIFSSFDPLPLVRIKEKSPKVQTAFLYNKPWTSLQEVMGSYFFSILTCSKSILTPAHISKAHLEGIKIHVYTLNGEEEITQFFQWGVDGMITDYPDRVIKILKTRKH